MLTLTDDATAAPSAAGSGPTALPPAATGQGDRPRWWLLIEAQPGEAPAVIRLRAALKRLLRSHGLSCLRVEDAGAGQARDRAFPPRPE